MTLKLNVVISVFGLGTAHTSFPLLELARRSESFNYHFLPSSTNNYVYIAVSSDTQLPSYFSKCLGHLVLLFDLKLLILGQ